MKRITPRKPSRPAGRKKPASATPPPENNTQPAPTGGPQFAESMPTADPTKFTVQHGSDTASYTILDKQKGTLQPRPFPVVTGTTEPVLTLAQTIGSKGDQVVSAIESAGQIVFHSTGDTGNTKGPKDLGGCVYFATTDQRPGG